MISKQDGIVGVVDDEGQGYFGHYHVERGLVTVKCRYGSKKGLMLIPGSDPGPTAARLLRKIISEKLKK